MISLRSGRLSYRGEPGPQFLYKAFRRFFSRRPGMPYGTPRVDVLELAEFARPENFEHR